MMPGMMGGLNRGPIDEGRFLKLPHYERISDNPDIPAAAQEAIVAKAGEGIDIVPVDDVEDAAREGGLRPDQASAVADDYSDAQLEALRLSLGAVALAALLSLWATRQLPSKALAGSDVALAGGSPAPG